MSMKKFYVGVKGLVREERGYLLLSKSHQSGDFWDTPGGRMDETEDFEDTLRREMAEELPGIEIISVGGLLGAHRLNKDIEAGTGLVLLYYLVEARLPDNVVLSEEHNSHLWVKSRKNIPEGLNDSLRAILHKQIK